MYGDPPVFKNLLWPQTQRKMEGNEMNHWILMGKDSYLIPIILKFCQLINEKIITKSYKQFAFDLMEVHHSHMRNFSQDKYTPLPLYGKIYPAILKFPSKFIKY